MQEEWASHVRLRVEFARTQTVPMFLPLMGMKLLMDMVITVIINFIWPI